ncbi:hypothetical protein MKY34_14050 [Sporosarcina sp. FSL K6-1522]|uniref:hypothetical protein n=1 Tax=Sporosarcina sp. FSL K6-1522 TaxID=2921554 RepID=UPI00315AAFDE
MGMRIVGHECKKALTSPILIGLLLLFTAFNIFIIVGGSHFKDELKVANQLVEKYGRYITDGSLQQFEKDLQADLAQLEELTGQQSNSVYDFIEQLPYEERELYSRDDWQFIEQLQLKEMYFGMANDIDKNYADIDLKQVAASDIARYGLSGNAEKILLREYDKFSQRFEEMKHNGEHKEWFFAGKAYFMHSFLFKTVFLHIAIEALILIILSTALITNYEFENRTHLVTYGTTRGRRLMKDKLGASVMTAALLTTFLLVVTLSTYFTIFDYTHLWGSAISSAFNWEYNFPNVAWWDLSVGLFIVGVIVIVYIAMLLFSGLTFTLTIFVKNSYIAAISMATFFILAWLIPSFMPTSSSLLFITSYNLSVLVMNIPTSFMGSSGLVMFKNFEWMTIVYWTMITIVCCVFSLKWFNKEDIQ